MFENNYKNHKYENDYKIVIPNENKKEKALPKTNEKQNYEIISIGIILLVTSLYYLIAYLFSSCLFRNCATKK